MTGPNLLLRLELNFSFASPNKQIETGFIPPYVKVVILGTADIKSCSMNAKVAVKETLKGRRYRE